MLDTDRVATSNKLPKWNYFTHSSFCDLELFKNAFVPIYVVFRTYDPLIVNPTIF